MKPESGNAACTLKITRQKAVCVLVRRVGDEICAGRDRLTTLLTENDGVEWKIDETGYRSPVTPLDKKASEALIKGLHEITPDIPVISEEMSCECQQSVLAGAHKKAENDNKIGPTYWSIDPIDGTKALVENRKHYAVLVGLIEDGQPTFGVSYFPKLDIMFFTQGGQAWEAKSGMVAELKMPTAFQHFVSEEGTAVRMKKDAISAFATKVGAVQESGFRPVRAKIKANDIPYGDIQLLRGELDLHYAGTRYQEWDLAAYQAIMETVGLRYVDGENGAPIIYGKDKNLRTPTYWLGHPVLLQRLGL